MWLSNRGVNCNHCLSRIEKGLILDLCEGESYVKCDVWSQKKGSFLYLGIAVKQIVILLAPCKVFLE